MRGWLPRKRLILAVHRWLGLLSAVFLVVLALTGLALNHSERLGLNQVTIDNRLILKRYGMTQAADITAFRIHDNDTLVHIDNRILLNGEPLAESGLPVGIYQGDAFSVVASADQLIYLNSDGELVELLPVTQLPFSRLLHLGTGDSGAPVLVAAEGQWQPDPDWLEFRPYTGPYTVDSLVSIDLNESARQELLEAYQGSGPSLYRVLLDLHSGRLFGWGGRTAMDLAALAILLLVSSGISGWLRQSRRLG